MTTDPAALRADLDRLLDSGRPDAATAATIEAASRDRLVAFVLLMAKWNRRWNLTAVREPVAMLERHVLDSLSLLPHVDAVLGASYRDPAGMDEEPLDLLDVGSGAGLPVLPLAIARPALRCLSVERTGKKARFQRQAVLELGLERVEVRAERIEAVAVHARVVTSRAFTAPEAFLALAARHIAPDGRVLLMLGRAERLPTPLPAPFRLLEVHALPGEAARHVAVCAVEP